MPPWQAGAPHGPGRMVPDVSANADPQTGYEVVIHGVTLTIGGTSAVAPLYAGLFAAFGRKLGFVTPKLWLNQTCFNDITIGDNGFFHAWPGPDPCTGIGTPIAARLATLFPAEQPMGVVPSVAREPVVLLYRAAEVSMSAETRVPEPMPGD